MSLFICPICNKILLRDTHTYRCANGHSYDIAKEGHTHLLPVNRKNSKMPGDDKGMEAAPATMFLQPYWFARLHGLIEDAE